MGVVASARAKRRDHRQHVGEADTLRERALGGALDHGAVGHRVGERHAELDHVGAGGNEPVQDRLHRVARRISGGDVRYQRGAPRGAELRERGVDPIHWNARPERSATVAMSLSPRPERLTRRILSCGIVAASRIA